MNEAVPRARNSSFLGHPLSVQMLSRLDARSEVFSKLKVNGAGELRTYLYFTHSAFS
jgi:hypothetical protein